MIVIYHIFIYYYSYLYDNIHIVLQFKDVITIPWLYHDNDKSYCKLPLDIYIYIYTQRERGIYIYIYIRIYVYIYLSLSIHIYIYIYIYYNPLAAGRGGARQSDHSLRRLGARARRPPRLEGSAKVAARRKIHSLHIIWRNSVAETPSRHRCFQNDTDLPLAARRRRAGQGRSLPRAGPGLGRGSYHII